MIPRSIDALERIFDFLEEELASHQVEASTAFKVKLAAEEVFTNLVRHQKGSAEQIEIQVDIDGESVVLRLVDVDSAPFDPASIPAVDIERPIAEREPGGLGLYLVETMLDEVVYEHRDGNLTVVLVKKRGG